MKRGLILSFVLLFSLSFVVGADASIFGHQVNEIDWVTSACGAGTVITGWSNLGAITCSGSTHNFLSAEDSVPAKALFIDADGDVGIGTESPTNKLHIYEGSLRITREESAQAGIYLETLADSAYNSPHIWFSASNAPGYNSYYIRYRGSDSGGMIFGRREASGDQTAQFVIKTATGNVGIGTTTPGAKLEVATPASGSTVLLGRRTGEASIKSSGPHLILDSAGNYAAINHYVADDVVLAYGGGDVGIGTNNPSVALDVSGSIEYTGSITDVSDERLKENFRPIKGALEKIQNINGMYFNMIDTPGTKEVGVIAQEVQEVVPEAVSVVDVENGYLGVSYVSLVPVLIEAVKEQQLQIQELKVENDALKEFVCQVHPTASICQ